MKQVKMSDIAKTDETFTKIQDVCLNKEFTILSVEYKEVMGSQYADVLIEMDKKKQTVSTSSKVLIGQLHNFEEQNDLGQVAISGVFLLAKSSSSGRTYYTFSDSLTE